VPVYLHRISQVEDHHQAAARRVIKDLPAGHRATEATQTWLQHPANFTFYSALFNDRMVGFVLLQGNEIKTLVVHNATRKRGVGQRMVAEIRRQLPAIQLPENCTNDWLIAQFNR
jgi:hypothetical protein